MIKFSIRSAHEGDGDFIKDTWIHALWKHHAYFKYHTVKSIFDNEISINILNYLSYGAKVRVAHKTEDSNDLIGFICYTEVDGMIIVHFMFVKQKFQKQGIGSSLLKFLNVNPESEEILTTSITDPVKKISKDKKVTVVLVDSLYDKYVSLHKNKLLKGENNNGK